MGGRRSSAAVGGKALWIRRALLAAAPPHAAAIRLELVPRRLWYAPGPTNGRHPLLAHRAEIEIAKRPDGSDWLLGSGGFGKVGRSRADGERAAAPGACYIGQRWIPGTHTDSACSAGLRLTNPAPARPPPLPQVYKALRHGVQPVAVKIIPVRRRAGAELASGTELAVAIGMLRLPSSPAACHLSCFLFPDGPWGVGC